MDAFLGTILIWPGSYAPRGWAYCNGALLSVSQNAALFALLGTSYGGNGTTNFGLPDLRGRVPMGAAQFPSQLGGFGGAASAAITGLTASGQVSIGAANLPAHTHPATLSLSGLTGETKIAVSEGVNGQTTATAGASLSSTATSGPTSAAIYLPTTPTSTVNLGGVTTTVSGTGSVSVDANTGGQPLPVTLPVTTAAVATLPPFQTVSYIICINGIYPSRN